MSETLIKKVKKYIYGSIPFFLTRLVNPSSPKLEYYKYIRENNYSRHIYPFAQAILNKPVRVMKDDEKGLFYVLHDESKRLYFPGDSSEKKIEKLYKNLIIEQHPEHPHHYIDFPGEADNKTILDIGAAEGIFSLDVIERAGMVYLFECDPKWVKALEATFEPWKEKVRIIKMYVSDTNDKMQQTLDSFLADKPMDNLFLKMDIEGAECKALNGSEGLFAGAVNLDFAICAYHKKNDATDIASFLDRFPCKYFFRKGYMYVNHRLRIGVIRGSKA